MKRHTQKTGVRKWAGEDFIELQGETLKALDGFFAEYGPCVVKGCEITNNGSRFNIAPGLVVLKGTTKDGEATIMIVPFKGSTGVTLPVYLTLACTVRERAYKNAEVKPIAYEYYAEATTVRPTSDYLTISATDIPRFVDVLQDSKHRFLTDAERTKWDAKETPEGANAKAATALQAAKDYADTQDKKRETPEGASAKVATALQTAKDYADAQDKKRETPEGASAKVATALQTAKDYADARDEAVIGIIDIKGLATLRSAKDYADTIVAALVDNSPAALNTLQELAIALGNDPNFATTVMQKIGEKVSTATYNAGMATKANVNGDANKSFNAFELKAYKGMTWAARMAASSQPNKAVFSTVGAEGEANYIRIGPGINDFEFAPSGDDGPLYAVYHKGNLAAATTSAPGLMSAADKATMGKVYTSDNLKAATTSTAGLMSAADKTTMGKVYTSDNLKAATTSTAGLMSTVDKAKSDANGILVAAGTVALNGDLALYKGSASVSHVVGTGVYTIYHTAGSKYTVLLTSITDDEMVVVKSKATSNCVIRGTSFANVARDCGFEFRIERYD